MQRLISALSLTLMLSSWAAVAQVPPSTPLSFHSSLPMTRADMAYALSQYLDRQQEPQ
jgi:hypothetical protein